MFKTLLLLGAVSLASTGAYAQAIPFTAVQYSTSAFATAEGTVDGTSAANPSAALPISSVATAAGQNDFANAAAVGGAGLLTATASTDSLLGAASAESYSRFIGSFSVPGPLRLNLSFNTFNTLSGGSGDGTLFVMLTTTVGTSTTTLFNGVYTQPGSYLLSYTLASGSTTQLTLFLTSDAATTAAGQSAQSFAQVGFTGAVPEPATWLMLLLGTGAVLLRRRGASR